MQSEYETSQPKISRPSVLADIDDSILENIYEDYYNRCFNSYSKLIRCYKCIGSKSNCKLILNYVTSKMQERLQGKQAVTATNVKSVRNVTL